MKKFIAIMTILLSITLFSTPTQAQKNKSVKTASIHVDGNCNMCKKRIEDAAYIKGVKRAEWDKKSATLTITYNTKSTSLDKIKANVAKAGHDAEDVKAADKTVENLPACCNYRHDDAHKH